MEVLKNVTKPQKKSCATYQAMMYLFIVPRRNKVVEGG